MARGRIGRSVLIGLLILWFLGIAAVFVLRPRPALFQTILGVLALLYGIALMVWRVEAAELMGRGLGWRLQFTERPRYRPAFLAFVGAGFGAMGLLALVTGVKQL